LDAIGRQSSACGWIRAGGLWTGRVQAQEESARARKAELLNAKMQAELQKAAQKDAAVASGTSSSRAAMDPLKREDELREQLRLSLLRKRDGPMTPPSPDVLMATSPDGGSDKEVEDLLDLSADEGTGTGDPISGSSSSVWYDDPVNLEYWVQRGTDILTRRGIDVLPDGGEGDANILPASGFDASGSLPFAGRSVKGAPTKSTGADASDAVHNSVIDGRTASAELLPSSLALSSITRIPPSSVVKTEPSGQGQGIQIPLSTLAHGFSSTSSSQVPSAFNNHPRNDNGQGRGRRGRHQQRGRPAFSASRGRNTYPTPRHGDNNAHRDPIRQERSSYDRDRDQQNLQYRESTDRSYGRWQYEDNYHSGYGRYDGDYAQHSGLSREQYNAPRGTDELGREIEPRYEHPPPQSSRASDVYRSPDTYNAYGPSAHGYDPHDPYWQPNDGRETRRPYY